MKNDNISAIMKEIFNSVDPVGLYFEKNEDEYEMEIAQFLKLNPDYKNKEAVEEMLSVIFAKSFEGVEIDSNKISMLANKICDAVRQ